MTRIYDRLVTEPDMLFALWLSFSGNAVHRIFASGGTEAFLQGHVHAFTTLGGVPTGKIRYDNLRAAVAQVLGFSRQRVETARWTGYRCPAPGGRTDYCLVLGRRFGSQTAARQ
ncbi:hypothetical protein [Actinoplanes xinjiangensis]|uniref:hypothetical protein n=1 Tax=Actinoplanes xinjiangensis TaxID=512350 RepID=UPI0034399D8B